MSTKASGAGGGADKPQSKAPVTAKKTKKKVNGKVGVKGSVTPPEVQAQIIAALLSGQFPQDQDVAHVTGVSKSTVSKLKKQIPQEYLKQVETVKKERVGELVVEFLESTLESLKAINVVTSTEEWISRQDAPGLAVFFGVKADKVAKILEAIERANQPETDEIPGTEGS